MSVCRHLPGGVTEFKWQINDYDQRLKTAVCGDVWTSDIFTANLPDKPKFSLLFTPPLPFKFYSKDYPFMANPFLHNHAMLCVLKESFKIGIKCCVWIEDENGDIFSRRRTCSIGFNECHMILSNLPSTTRHLSIYYHITKEAVVTKSNEEEKVVDLLSVESSAPEYTFVLEISNGFEEFQEYELDGKKFTLRYNNDTTTFKWDNSALNECSYERYLFKIWMENESGHRSFIISKNVQPFRDSIFTLWKSKIIRTLATHGFSRFFVKVRPFRNCLFDQIRHLHTVNFNSSQFGNVKVVASDGGVFYMPKIVLFLHSDEFVGQVDLDSKTLETILWLMCTGKVKNKKMANSELYAIAGHYQLDEIQDLIVESMSDNLCVESALDALKLAFEFDHMLALRKEAMKFVLDNFDKIAKLNEWNQFAVSHVEIVTQLVSASRLSSQV
ncbi:hypothetical protein M3Y98_00390500 [Aphelenchoides besseyi]|nr:hypothetical protein M3Y98_00390500 [Aphelenchoides besseyi]KAI6202384.1 hypothetical protein M3Y96_00942800 [Aphelenchoides besseyi]